MAWVARQTINSYAFIKDGPLRFLGVGRGMRSNSTLSIREICVVTLVGQWIATTVTPVTPPKIKELYDVCGFERAAVG